MIRRTTLKNITPVLLFLLFLLDAHVTRIIAALTNNAYVANAHLALLVLLLVSRVVNQRFLLGTSLAIGFLYDLYYIGVIGIYAVIFPMLVMLFYLFKQIIQQNILTLFFTVIISVTLFETISLLLQTIFGLTGVSSDFFIPRYLGPTLLFNILMFVILIFPLEKLLIDPTEDELSI
ncbi:rod shape-determining protein MreD [Enterococcus dongliensis]|uniref:Rod shape-determining protein MreD n=1 Tax=Enterococcus dongliensis TaxID=2559925 RepID=A0AAP5KQD0_9ENTE|nr:rod shape-determining protein MreD [Enterococcus dongliensis]MDT2596459.1 rod shape-determining protein MreD [Enterococcus dongliensis]MDT2604081.1 rod shape-determining protein MreD [Enterococcus dongliensis]MDT2613092.1 rod shape-determining protein MreD [Enterococcus dongliensis]MDT2634501.1 rod shape-determining protein MreD [Enterococcus dongliensis]MDT2636451.1 rod shape-determining protein MreD [Enterococcus dongliensis]